MKFVKLTDEQRRRFDEDGFLVVPKVVDPAEVARLVKAADRIMEPHFSGDKAAGRQIHIREDIIQEEAFASLLSCSRTVPLVVQLLSPNLHLHTATVTYKAPENSSDIDRRGWHRDIGILEDLGHDHLPRVGIKVCYCLTDFHERYSGITLLARKSHMRATPLALPTGQADPEEVVEPMMNAGDALLFENRIYHSFAPNLTQRTSKVIFYGYSYRWMKPDINLYFPDKDLIEKADDIDRQLLGEHLNVDAPPRALANWAAIYGVEPRSAPNLVEV